jgi:hypothetical protein
MEIQKHCEALRAVGAQAELETVSKLETLASSFKQGAGCLAHKIGQAALVKMVLRELSEWKIDARPTPYNV